MKLFEIVIQEYLSIIELLEENESVENNRIIIDREYFKDLLENYNYMKFKDKTKIYKDLNFIMHDKNNYTLPVRDDNLNKTVRKVVFNYATYLTVRKLYEKEIIL